MENTMHFPNIYASAFNAVVEKRRKVEGEYDQVYFETNRNADSGIDWCYIHRVLHPGSDPR